MTKILDAKSIIESKIDNLTQTCQLLKEQGLGPKLSVILVGENQASVLYVRNKERFCDRIGAEFELIKLPESISEKEFLSQLNRVNNDDSVTGCFVQLPVPKQLSHLDITQLINPEKDVDGFHLQTINDLYLNKLDNFIPCTPKGIVTLLQENQITIEGKNVVIIGRSHIVGKPLSLLMQALNATVTLCHSKTKNIKEHTQLADIIISAVGIPHLITPDYINPTRKQVVIDVGMNKLAGKTVGDVDFEAVKDLTSAITPVPGGVGPMTVFSLMQNLLLSTERILKRGK